jgi:hypothetical protein
MVNGRSDHPPNDDATESRLDRMTSSIIYPGKIHIMFVMTVSVGIAIYAVSVMVPIAFVVFIASSQSACLSFQIATLPRCLCISTHLPCTSLHAETTGSMTCATGEDGLPMNKVFLKVPLLTATSVIVTRGRGCPVRISLILAHCHPWVPKTGAADRLTSSAPHPGTQIAQVVLLSGGPLSTLSQSPREAETTDQSSEGQAPLAEGAMLSGERARFARQEVRAPLEQPRVLLRHLRTARPSQDRTPSQTLTRAFGSEPHSLNEP